MGSECGRPFAFCGFWLCLFILALAPQSALAGELQMVRSILPLASLRLPEEAPAEATKDAEEASAAEFVEPYFPYLAGEARDRSLSVGNTSDGFLVNGTSLTESDALGILPRQRKRGLNYGTQALVGVIERAAKRLHEATGTRLWAGNLGRRGGGDIAYSISHNSGRDADLAFCYMDRRGKPLDPPDLLPLTGAGVALRRGYRFDVARTWMVVTALLSDPETQVQYLFIARGLRGLLLQHAYKTQAPRALIEQAALVLQQPTGAAPHNDHLHLRIFCGEHDVASGCQNTGALHPKASFHEKAKKSISERASELLATAENSQKERAIQRLELLGASDQAPAIANALRDPWPGVRAAAARGLASLGGREHVATLTQQFEFEDEPLVRVALVETLGSLGGRQAGKFLSKAIGSPRRDPYLMLPLLDAAAHMPGPAFLSLAANTARLSGGMLTTDEWPSALGYAILADDSAGADPERLVQLAAIEAAGRSERLEPAGALMKLLNDREGHVRQAAGRALRILTNLSYGVDWQAADYPARLRGQLRWHAAWRRSFGAPRDSWLATGFIAAGYGIKNFRQRYLWELVRAVGGPDHLSFNAQRVLMRVTRHRPTSRFGSKSEACWHWYKWVRSRHKGFRLPKAPTKTVRACANPSKSAR